MTKPRYMAHYGGPQPVADDVVVEVVLRKCRKAYVDQAFAWCWDHIDTDAGGDIIAYRVIEEDGDK